MIRMTIDLIRITYKNFHVIFVNLNRTEYDPRLYINIVIPFIYLFDKCIIRIADFSRQYNDCVNNFVRKFI